MALAISNIPVLTGEVAERFVQQAEYNYRHRVFTNHLPNARKKKIGADIPYAKSL